MTKVKIAIVAGEFHTELSNAMIAAAKREADKHGAEVTHVVTIPGSYEVPLIADALLARGGIDALVALGYIERGETQHGEVMGHAVHAALVQLALTHKKPIGIGIIGPGATKEQAEPRKEPYAEAAVRAALRSLTELAKI